MTGPAGRVDDTGRADGNGAGAPPVPPATGHRGNDRAGDRRARNPRNEDHG
ncbi:MULTISPECIES: hypothetical protein [Protofrankia]|uniref:hypothetical protein n=1 Tax=Protofrankia TaxID=2994361 RepID=UPI00138F5040|nr:MULTISPECIES: hypothetical protein [Protofrankia]